MAKEQKMTADQYVVERLLKVEAENTQLISKNECLQKDLNDFLEDFLKIKDHFKVELASGETELKLTFYEEPDSKYRYGNTLIFSGSLEPSSFRNEFKLYIQLLKLSDEVERVLEELKNEDGEGSTENQ